MEFTYTYAIIMLKKDSSTIDCIAADVKRIVDKTLCVAFKIEFWNIKDEREWSDNPINEEFSFYETKKRKENHIA